MQQTNFDPSTYGQQSQQQQQQLANSMPSNVQDPVRAVPFPAPNQADTGRGARPPPLALGAQPGSQPATLPGGPSAAAQTQAPAQSQPQPPPGQQAGNMDPIASSSSSDEAFLAAAFKKYERQGGGQRFMKHGRKGRPQYRLFWISDDHSKLYWDTKRKKKENACITFSQVTQIIEGQKTSNFERNKSASDEVQSFSLVLPDRSLDLVAPDPEAKRIWVRFLSLVTDPRKKKAVNEIVTHGDAYEEYLLSVWNSADKDRNGTLSVGEVQKVLDRMNIASYNKAKSKKLIMKYDDNHNGQLEFAEFKAFLEDLQRREELVELISAISPGQTTLDLNGLSLFMREVQKEILSNEQLQAIIAKYSDSTDKTVLSARGFGRFLDSRENDVFMPDRLRLYQDMKLPLSHYWINSSHNTYLAGDQLQGTSSVEMYRFVLQKGCRCVELDCWDGPTEPIIYHGHTLTSKITFRGVIQAIKETAFTTSPYPVILSIEMHCSGPFQDMMAAIVEEILVKDNLVALLDPQAPKMQQLPSPTDLKYKILIKGKTASSLPEDDEEDDEEGTPNAGLHPGHAKTKAKKSDITPNWSKLVYLKAIHFKSFDIIGAANEMSSFGETKTMKFAATQRDGFIHYNQKQLSRVYPLGSRIDSSNLDPVPAWNSGCQLVALNLQTDDRSVWTNNGKFMENDCCGYVMKPMYMLDGRYRSAACNLTMRIMSGQRLPKPDNQTQGDIVDPYVLVELVGLPEDCTTGRTQTIQDNGFNPVFGETFNFSISDVEVALLRFLVYDQDVTVDDFLGYSVVAISCIRPGVRHIALYDSKGAIISNSGLLCSFTFSAYTPKQH